MMMMITIIISIISLLDQSVTSGFSRHSVAHTLPQSCDNDNNRTITDFSEWKLCLAYLHSAHTQTQK